jgi:hypothetical protein
MREELRHLYCKRAEYEQLIDYYHHTRQDLVMAKKYILKRKQVNELIQELKKQEAVK